MYMNSFCAAQQVLDTWETHVVVIYVGNQTKYYLPASIRTRASLGC